MYTCGIFGGGSLGAAGVGLLEDGFCEVDTASIVACSEEGNGERADQGGDKEGEAGFEEPELSG